MVSNVDGQKIYDEEHEKKMLVDATHRKKNMTLIFFFLTLNFFWGGERGQSFVFIEKHVLRVNFCFL